VLLGRGGFASLAPGASLARVAPAASLATSGPAASLARVAPMTRLARVAPMTRRVEHARVSSVARETNALRHASVARETNALRHANGTSIASCNRLAKQSYNNRHGRVAFAARGRYAAPRERAARQGRRAGRARAARSALCARPGCRALCARPGCRARQSADNRSAPLARGARGRYAESSASSGQREGGAKGANCCRNEVGGTTPWM